MGSKLFELFGNYKNFSKKQKAIYDYTIKNAYGISMMNAAQLSSAINVGEATLFRFLKQIGYETYSDFKADVHAYALEEMNSNYWQLRTTLESNKEYRQNGPETIIRRSISLLEKTISANMLHSVSRAVELMLDAPKIGILGLRLSKGAALYFEYLLLPFLPKITQLSHDESFIYDRLQHFNKDSVVFFITGWPFSKNTAKAARYCAESGHKIILLTNNAASPLAPLANVVITVLKPADYYTSIPFIAVLEAITVEIALRLSPGSQEQLKELDSILVKYNIIDKNA